MRSAAGRDQISNTSPHARGPVRRLSITPSRQKIHPSLYPPALPTCPLSVVSPWASRYATRRAIGTYRVRTPLQHFLSTFSFSSSFFFLSLVVPFPPPTLPCRHRLHIFNHLSHSFILVHHPTGHIPTGPRHLPPSPPSPNQPPTPLRPSPSPLNLGNLTYGPGHLAHFLGDNIRIIQGVTS